MIKEQHIIKKLRLIEHGAKQKTLIYMSTLP